MVKKRPLKVRDRIEEYLAQVPRFGMIAVDMGFVTAQQLKEVLTEQIEDDLSNRPHRLVGEMFFDRGWMTHDQIETVLNRLSNEKRGKGVS